MGKQFSFLKKTLAIMTLLCVFILPTTVGATVLDLGYPRLFTPDDPEFLYTPLYREADEMADILGYYRGGKMALLLEDLGDWYHVMLGVRPAIMTGFMPAELFTEGDPITPTAYVGVVSSANVQVCAYDKPDIAADVIGKYDVGTCLEVLGICGDFFHVQLGRTYEDYTSAFLKKRDVEYIDRPYVLMSGINTIGYAAVKEDSDDPIYLRSFPSRDSKFIAPEHIANEAGMIIDLVAITEGEWCQVKYYTDSALGFLPKECLELYVFSQAADLYGISLHSEEYIIIDTPRNDPTISP